MTREVPETGLATKATIDEDIETADAEQGRIALAAREDIQRRVAEPYVTHYVRRFQQLLQSDGRKDVRDVLDEGI